MGEVGVGSGCETQEAGDGPMDQPHLGRERLSIVVIYSQDVYISINGATHADSLVKLDLRMDTWLTLGGAFPLSP